MPLVLAFDTDDSEFGRGVEVGQMWTHLDTLPSEATTYERTVRTSNLEMVLRMAESCGWALRPEAAQTEDGESFDEWTVVHLHRVAHHAHDVDD